MSAPARKEVRHAPSQGVPTEELGSSRNHPPAGRSYRRERRAWTGCAPRRHEAPRSGQRRPSPAGRRLTRSHGCEATPPRCAAASPGTSSPPHPGTTGHPPFLNAATAWSRLSSAPVAFARSIAGARVASTQHSPWTASPETSMDVLTDHARPPLIPGEGRPRECDRRESPR